MSDSSRTEWFRDHGIEPENVVLAVDGVKVMQPHVTSDGDTLTLHYMEAVGHLYPDSAGMPTRIRSSRLMSLRSVPVRSPLP